MPSLHSMSCVGAAAAEGQIHKFPPPPSEASIYTENNQVFQPAASVSALTIDTDTVGLSAKSADALCKLST